MRGCENMADKLSTEQVLLLNNLMYMTDDPPLQSISSTRAKTIGEYISAINITRLYKSRDYGSYMTGNDWKNLIEAVKNDNQLMNIKIEKVHIAEITNDGGGGVSAVFVDSSTNEAVITFRGTSNLEWKDNLIGGGQTDMPDKVSTPCQDTALKWYQSLELEQYETVTVTGHSKGGNKAKYITIMDNSVDRCLSFDGQGFSDEFMKHYADRIALNQDKITNNNIDSDFVNLLLNDLGNTIFYKGYDYGEGHFLENHCPNTFFCFSSNGTYHLTESTRDPRMEVIDEFLNNYLRTLPVDQKKETLIMLGEIIEGGFNNVPANDLLKILLEGNNVSYAANIFAYILKYQKVNPELINAVNGVLEDMDMKDIAQIVNIASGIANWRYFDKIVDILAWRSLYIHIPDFAYKLLQDYLIKYGIILSRDDLKKLLGMLNIMANDMDNIIIKDNGEDIKISSWQEENIGLSLHTEKSCHISILFQKVQDAEDELLFCSSQLQSAADEIQEILIDLKGSLWKFKANLSTLENKVRKQGKQCGQMKNLLQNIRNCYEKTETEILEKNSFNFSS